MDDPKRASSATKERVRRSLITWIRSKMQAFAVSNQGIKNSKSFQNTASKVKKKTMIEDSYSIFG